MCEALYNLRLLIRKWVVQYPHAARVAAVQAEGFYRFVISRLSVLQLVKMLVHQGDEPRRTGPGLGVLRLTHHDHRRRSKRREGRQKRRIENPRPRVQVFRHLSE